MKEESRNIGHGADACTQPGCGGKVIDVPGGDDRIKTKCDKCGHEGSRPGDASEYTEGSALPNSAEKYPFTK